jgi:hypothetical protein
MALTKRQLDKILKIINDRVLGFTYEALGERALTSEEITNLKRLGLLTETTRHMIADPIALGRLTALLPPSASHGITYGDVERMIPREALTDVERKMVRYASESAGEYIKGIKDRMVRDVRVAASGEALRQIREGVATSIANRETVSQLKTRLFDIIDDKSRDWRMVAQTEMNNAVQNGVFNEIRQKSDEGEDQLVFKRPRSDACQYCKKVYLESDGITPKIMKLKDLANSNFGLKASEWQPTIGSVHPHCNCQLNVLPKGYGFVKMNTANEDFEFEGVEYKRGEIINDAIYSRLGKLKDKTRKEAVLAYGEGDA